MPKFSTTRNQSHNSRLLRWYAGTRAEKMTAICRSWIRPATTYTPAMNRHEQYAFFYKQYVRVQTLAKTITHLIGCVAF